MENLPGNIGPIQQAEAAVNVAGKALLVVDKGAAIVEKKTLAIFGIVFLALFLGSLFFLKGVIKDSMNGKDESKNIYKDQVVQLQKDLIDAKKETAEARAERDLAIRKNEYKDSIQALTNVTVGRQDQTIKFLQSQLEKR